MAELVVGPLLRYVSGTEATIWVETDAPCEVAVLGHRARTFQVEGHHYGIVAVRGLTPGLRYEYTVTLDGDLRWPRRDFPFPPSVLRTVDPAHRIRVMFGSCRVSAPHALPYSLDRVVDRRGRGLDALAAYTRRLIDAPREEWPQLLLLLGDQVYADDVPAGTLAFIRSRRSSADPPGESVADFQEYAALYRESWSEPLIRWLLSTVPSAMIFDDHEVHDDWNISESWLAEMRRLPWWEERIAGAFMSYWVYQHLGNLPPDELEAEPLHRLAREVDDVGPALREFVLAADRESGLSRWSYRRDLGASRLVVLDGRAGRVLADGRRDMFDEAEWRWVEENAIGGVDHLIIASSLPFLLAEGMHHLQAWSEAVSGGAWGPTFARFAESLRRALDLEHWASFRTAFDRLSRVLRVVASGRRGVPPATILILSGDVHHTYLARVARPHFLRSAVYQIVCSPFRNSLGPAERRAQRIGASRVGAVFGRALARGARISPPLLRWRRLEPLAFDNQVGTLTLAGRVADVRLERVVQPSTDQEPVLETVWERRLAS